MYVNDLEKARKFFITYFNASSNDGYYNNLTEFRSYFLTFEEEPRLELMNKPVMEDESETLTRTGLIHIALSVGRKEGVDVLTARLKGRWLSGN